jgi:hypothetical protein
MSPKNEPPQDEQYILILFPIIESSINRRGYGWDFHAPSWQSFIAATGIRISRTMASLKSIQDQTLPTPKSILSLDDLSSHDYFSREEILGSSELDYQEPAGQQPKGSTASFATEIRRIPAKIDTQTRVVASMPTSESKFAIDEEKKYNQGTPKMSQHLDKEEFELESRDRKSNTTFDNRTQDLRTAEEFWKAHRPREKTCSRLLAMFIDFIHHGRPARNIKGVKHRFSLSVSDDPSTTILIFGRTYANGEITWQSLQWTPHDDVVGVRDDWESVCQYIRDNWHVNFKTTDLEAAERWGSRRDANDDFAYGAESANGCSVELTRFSYSKNGDSKRFYNICEEQSLSLLSDQVFGRCWYV